jgi:hypothetical protein
MRFGVVTVAAAMLVATTWQAQPVEQTSGRHILFLEPNSCGAWMDFRRSGSRGNQGYEGWVLGYLSGVNLYGGYNKDFLEGIDAHSAWLWVDDYCGAHPLESLATAATNLAAEWLRRAAPGRSQQ